MGKKGGSTPVPDPQATAQAQATANKETAIAQAGLNATNQITPYGTLSYQQIGTWSDGTPRYQATTELNPTQQAALNQEQQLGLGTSTLANQQLGRIQGNISQEFDYSGVPTMPSADTNARQQVIDSMLAQSRSRLDPQFASEENRLKTDLANRGIAMDSDAYQKALAGFGRDKTDAYQTAENQAIAGGGAEQSRLFGLGLTARQQGIQEYATKRNAPLNEAAALLGTQPIQNPTFVNTPQTSVQPTDVVGATSLAANIAGQNNDRRAQAYQSVMGALGGLGGAGLMRFSDMRLKKDIKRVGSTPKGLGVYSFRYIFGGPVQVGVMAQEVLKVNPSAVHSVGGFLMVNYGEIE